MKSLKRTQTKDYIIQAIRNEILSGNIPSGEELAQETLADMLGISRMPVREALQALVEEGFAKRLPNRHIQAVVLNKEQIRETLCVMGTAEAETLILSVKKGADTGMLGTILAKLEETDDQAEKARLELEFHRAVMKLPDNPYLYQIQRKVLEGYVAYGIENMGDKDEVSRLLEKLVKAVEAGDFPEIRTCFENYYELYANEFEERWTQ